MSNTLIRWLAGVGYLSVICGGIYLYCKAYPPTKKGMIRWFAGVVLLVALCRGIYLYDHRGRVLAELVLEPQEHLQKVRVVEEAPGGRLFSDSFAYRAEFWRNGVLEKSNSVGYPSFSAEKGGVILENEKVFVTLDGGRMFELSQDGWRILIDDLR